MSHSLFTIVMNHLVLKSVDAKGYTGSIVIQLLGKLICKSCMFGDDTLHEYVLMQRTL